MRAVYLVILNRDAPSYISDDGGGHAKYLFWCIGIASAIAIRIRAMEMENIQRNILGALGLRYVCGN